LKIAPVIEVEVNGRAVASAFYTLLRRATVRDEEGQTSDSLHLVLDDRGNMIDIPAKGALMRVRAGWRGMPLVDKGTFKLETPKITGGADGEFIELTGKGGDLKTKLKGTGSEHHEKTTLGAIVRKSAGRAGLQAVVDPDLDRIEIAYRARHGQSEIDFLTRLADENGGIVKPAGQKLIVAKRGAATSASGKPLPKIIVAKADCESWSFEPAGRTQYGRIGASWIDQKTGKTRMAWASTGLKGPDHKLAEPAADEKAARNKADAERQRLNRATGEGSVTLAGLMEASAGADLETTGFRAECNGLWRVTSVEHEFEGSSGWKTTIDFKAREDGRKGGYKDEE
jgi:phage protein D